jgi:hypothetical protein
MNEGSAASGAVSHTMWEFFYYLIVMCLLAGGIGLVGVLVHGYATTGVIPNVSFFMGAPRPEPRIDVVEHANVDGKRKLLLVRRDDVEHLIMTGGPVDVVIETGIGQMRRPLPDIVETQPVYARQPRKFGQPVEQ